MISSLRGKLMLLLLRLRFRNLSGYFIQLNTIFLQNLFLHYTMPLFIHMLLQFNLGLYLYHQPATNLYNFLLQKRAIQAISKADYKASSKPLFANLKILDVFSIYSLQVSSFIYLYHHDALPIAFTQIFQTGNQIHQYSTRYSDFYRPHTCRTNIKKFSILFQGPRIWNSLPNNIKNAPTFNIFKRVIKPFLRVR